jgi:hypothetical protein
MHTDIMAAAQISTRRTGASPAYRAAAAAALPLATTFTAAAFDICSNTPSL